MEKLDTDIILPTLKMFNVTKKGRHYTLPSGEDVPSVTNVQSILDKLGVHSKVEAVSRAFRDHLL